MQHALYRMKNNSHLGDCVAVVTKLDNKFEEIGFTRPEIVTFIKPSPNSWKRITSLVALKSEDLFSAYTPFLRVGSECMFGMFGDTHCNCEPERMTILQQIHDAYGVYVHLPQEGQGMGLYYKAQELHIQTTGYDPNRNYVGQLPQAEAAKILTGNNNIDRRDFSTIASVLDDLGLLSYEYNLISQSQSKSDELKAAGIPIVGLSDTAQLVTSENLGEHLTKAMFKGQALTDVQVQQILRILQGTDVIPPRASALLSEILISVESQQEQLALSDDVTTATQNTLFELLRHPVNPSLKNSQAQIWNLLEQGTSYDEFQYSFVLTKKADAFIADNWKPDKGETKIWHEKNIYFFPPAMEEGTRDLKIRETYDPHGRFLSGQLIHKIKIRENYYRIRLINFDDLLFSQLLQKTVLAEYDQRIIESLTIPYHYSSEDAKVFIKRYTSSFRTISLEGEESQIRRLRQDIEDGVERRLETVRTDGRCFGPELSDTFNLETAKSLETTAFMKYSGLS